MINKCYSVQNLRKIGYKIKIEHKRVFITNEYDFQSYLFSRYDYDQYLHNLGNPDLLGPMSRGGQCNVSVTSPNNVTVTGVSNCSYSDNYSKRIGLAKALGRAMSKLNYI